MSKPSITDLDMNYQRAFAIRNPKNNLSNFFHNGGRLKSWKAWKRDVRSCAVIIPSNSTDDEIPRTPTQPSASWWYCLGCTDKLERTPIDRVHGNLDQTKDKSYLQSNSLPILSGDTQTAWWTTHPPLGGWASTEYLTMIPSCFNEQSTLPKNLVLFPCPPQA